MLMKINFVYVSVDILSGNNFNWYYFYSVSQE